MLTIQICTRVVQTKTKHVIRNIKLRFQITAIKFLSTKFYENFMKINTITVLYRTCGSVTFNNDVGLILICFRHVNQWLNICFSLFSENPLYNTP